MERLPWDVIMIVLCRLPVKCLLCFRCVSKTFRSRIDSQEFIKNHLERSIETDSNLSLLLSDTKPALFRHSQDWSGKIFSASLDSLDIAVELDHPFNNYEGGTIIIDSCNGLIALRNYLNNIALWNPSTKKHLVLPNLRSHFKYAYTFVDGFGYDAASDDYKVVRIKLFPRERTKDPELYVYSLKSNYWRRIRVDFPCYFPRYDGTFVDGRRVDFPCYDGTFVDGRVHWLAKKNRQQEEVIVVAFDLKNEELHEVQLPSIKYLNLVKYDGMNLCSFRGSLYFSCRLNGEVDIWVMKESWTKSFSFSRTVYGIFDYVEVSMSSKRNAKVLADRSRVGDNDEDEDVNLWKLSWLPIPKAKPYAYEVKFLDEPIHCCQITICVDSLVSLAAAYTEGREEEEEEEEEEEVKRDIKKR